MIEPGLHNMDCMLGMKEFPDGYFDLAIVDPPYGGAAVAGGQPLSGLKGGCADFEGRARSRFGGIFDRYHIGAGDTSPVSPDSLEAQEIRAGRTGGTWAAKYQAAGAEDIRHWDRAPPPEYFTELARVSKQQIIWGGNYFDLPPTRCFIVWRKLTISEVFTMAMCEYAWTSFNDNAKWVEMAPQGSAKEKRFHPTQKPVALYTWLLAHYAHKGDKILDTHAGSASSLVACHRAGLECVGFEIDKTYYDLAKQRLDVETAQLRFEI